MGTSFSYIENTLTELNLFKSGSNEAHIIRQQRWSTRLYVVLLIISLVILLLYTAFGIQTVYVTVQQPSRTTFEMLRMNYLETLKCPCSQIAVKYERFLQMQPLYHQICSSSFITPEWISAAHEANSLNMWPMDTRTILSAHAQFLRSFCTNAQRGNSFVLNNLLSSSLVSAEALPFSLVQLQVDIQKETLRSAGKWQMSVLLSFTGLVTSSSHLMTGLGTNALAYILSNDSSTATMHINAYQMNNNSDPCYCLSMDNCPNPGAIYSTHQMPTYGFFKLDSIKSGSSPIKGIQGGCFPLGSALSSTLECYYDSSCLQLLSSKSGSFPALSSTLASHFSQNETIENLINAVMVEDWVVNMSYANHYAECAPKTCTYSFNRRNDFLIIFTTILALTGGLNTILRLLAPWVIQILMMIKQRLQSRNTPVQRIVFIEVEKISRLHRVKNACVWLWEKVRILNLFNSKSNNISIQKHERQTTRFYVVFVAITFIILVCYTVIVEETVTYTVQSPSQSNYENLYTKYSKTMECSCSNIAIKYSTFIMIQANHHQICLSTFISPLFFTQLAMIRTDIPLYQGDFMLISVEYFQWLTTFCALSQLVFYNQLAAFQTKLFVNSKLLSHDAFDVQAGQLADFFISDVQYYFARGIKQTRELLGVSQPLSATSTITYKLPITRTSSGSQVRIEPADIFPGCSCLYDPTSCSDAAAFYSYNPTNNSFSSVFQVLGVRLACSSMETLLQSNLACWYSSECYTKVVEYWQNRTYFLANIPPLLISNDSNRLKPSTPLTSLVEQLMVESWSKEISYNLYFSQCAPRYCTYSITQRRDVILIVTILLGLFGGLNIALKILTPLLIQLGSWLTTHGRQCLKSLCRNIRESPGRLRQLNLFYDGNRSSESTIEQERYSTRLYLPCLIFCMLTLLFYHSFVQSTNIISVSNPTQQVYEKLRQSKDIFSLECPCTHISISYDKFVQTNTSLHEICSSAFVQKAWLKSIFGNGDWSNLSANSFSGRGVIYFQGLHSLCYSFQENMTQYVTHFLSSTLISAQVLSEHQLISQVNETLEQTKASSRADQGAMYKFARELHNANQMMSIYSSNWIFSPINYDPNLAGLPIPLEPVLHGNCSCAISGQCNEPVMHNGQIVPGLVLGCLPLESLFQSTLVCFYNQTCIDQINIGHLSVTPLTIPSDKGLSIERTMEQLMDNALDLQWSININYTEFFNECQPASCFYSFSQRKDLLVIIITLLGLYGGLTVALRMIIPYIITFVHQIALKYRKTQNNIQPITLQKY